MTLDDLKRRIERDVYDKPLRAILTTIVDAIADKLVTAQGLVLEAEARAQAIADRMEEMDDEPNEKLRDLYERGKAEPARPEPGADVVREVVEALRAVMEPLEPYKLIPDDTFDLMDVGKHLATFRGGTFIAANAALAAYDASPPSPAPDAGAIRDAALEEAARFADRIESYDDNLQKSAGCATTGQRIAAGIRALRSSPAPEPVTEEELKAELMHMSFATHATVAGFIAERFAGRTITRKPKEG